MKIKATIIAVAVGASALTACGTSERWCEFDRTDTVVADSFCKAGTPGYEWETGSSKTKRRHGGNKVKNNAVKPGTVKHGTSTKSKSDTSKSNTGGRRK